MSELIARTAVDKTLYSFDKPFDYLVPEYLQSRVTIGSRVLVPFGKGNRKRQAIVTELFEEEKPDARLKSLAAAPDDYPLLTKEMTVLSDHLAKRCYCTRFDAVRAMLPIGINYRISSVYSLAKAAPGITLTSKQEELLSLLPPTGKEISQENLFKALDTDCETKELCELMSHGIVKKTEKAMRRVRDASETMLRVLHGEQNEKLTPRQSEVYELLKQIGEVSERELRYFTGASKGVIDGLVKKGFCEIFKREVYRTPEAVYGNDSSEIVLTPEQETAYNTLLSLYNSEKAEASLLYGVTGAGKTAVFMKLMEQAAKSGRGIIVMVPEIALTPQLVAKFKARFGQQVAVFHSGLSMGERLDEWKRVRFGKAKIAVGTRSAVFAPFEDIGLIIMDEEQEYTYKSEQTPRFHARDAAKLRCAAHNALLVLASATPSIESYYLAKTGVYTLCTLKHRYGEAKLPEVIVSDMNEEKLLGNTSGFSETLLCSLEDTLSNGEQSIILINRRGYNTAVTCKNCSEAVTCPSCSISLTYHADNGRLMCHYCGFSMKLTDECPKCGCRELKYVGSGTQRAEEALRELFPKAKILRLDADSTLAKQSHEIKLNDFRSGKYDILLGTQMVAKGLDFPNVTLVGVLSADQTMYGDDYRSYERAFSLMTQVVGRSGRGSRPGIAVIQTYTPENPLISLAASQDYESFYASEIELRRVMLYPPFADICMLGITSEREDKCREAAQELSRRLCTALREDYSEQPVRILGPSPASVYRISGRYRYKIILKFKNSRRFRQMLSEVLVSFSSDRRFSETTVFADVDPDNIM